VLWTFGDWPESGEDVQNLKKSQKNSSQTLVGEKNRQDLPPSKPKKPYFSNQIFNLRI
jgi:hypothetical protein